MSTTATPTVVRYEPRGAARQLFRERGDEVVLAGPAGTGKSLAALYRLHLAALNNPGIRCLIVRKTAVALGSTTLVTFEERVAAAALKAKIVVWFGGSTRKAPGYIYSNGSVINVGGMDNPVKIMSSDYDLIFADEATELTETDWEAITTRLRNARLSWQQAIAACNPAQRTHWIKQRSQGGSLLMIHSRHQDNPAYFNEDGTMTDAGRDYMGKLDNLTGVRRLRLRDGIWASAEGVIYEEWDERVHIIDRFDIPEEWSRYWVVDFGFVHPMVIQFWAEDPDGRLYLYRELFHTKRTVDQMALAALELVTKPNPDFKAPADGSPVPAYKRRGEWTEPKPRMIICDHDAEGRAVLERELGRSTRAAKKAVQDGIQAVQGRIRIAGDGKPRIFILRDSRVGRDQELADAMAPTSTEEEIPGYVWDTGPGRKPKEAPVKEKDDGCDGMRYIVMQRDPRTKPSMRVMK